MCIASKTTEMQGHLQLSRPRHRGPQRLLRTTDANLVCAFDENDLLFIVPNIWRAGAPLYDPPPCMSVFPPTLFAYVIPISCWVSTERLMFIWDLLDCRDSHIHTQMKWTASQPFIHLIHPSFDMSSISSLSKYDIVEQSFILLEI